MGAKRPKILVFKFWPGYKYFLNIIVFKVLARYPRNETLKLLGALNLETVIDLDLYMER